MSKGKRGAAFASEPGEYGYLSFKLGGLTFSRDEYFVHIRWPEGSHMMPADHFLRDIVGDVAWRFFYGTLNFDEVSATINHYGSVDFSAGHFNQGYRESGADRLETFEASEIRGDLLPMLEDWTNRGFDPFASPAETGSAFSPKNGSNPAAINRTRVTGKRMVGLPEDEPLRTDENGYPVNRQFEDVGQDEREVIAEAGFKDQVHAFNLAAYLSRSDCTWNPSVVSVCKNSLMCPTTEEYVLPVTHGNDRVEWFVQLSDEIYWNVEDRQTAAPRAKVVMRPGDVAAMPADIRHRGYSPKRAMLIVWENGSPELPGLIASGKLPTKPVKF